MRWRVDGRGTSWEFVETRKPGSVDAGEGEPLEFRSVEEARRFLLELARGDSRARLVLRRLAEQVQPPTPGRAGLGRQHPETPGRRLRESGAVRYALGAGPGFEDGFLGAAADDLLAGLAHALHRAEVHVHRALAPVLPRSVQEKEEEKKAPPAKPDKGKTPPPRLVSVRWDKETIQPRHVPVVFTRMTDPMTGRPSYLHATPVPGEEAEQRAAIEVTFENVLDDSPDSVAELLLEGRRPKLMEARGNRPLDPGDASQWEWVELPLSLLGLTNPAAELEVRGGRLVAKGKRAGSDHPPLELRLPYDWNEKAGGVYPMDCDRFRVHVRLTLPDAQPPVGGTSSNRLDDGLVSNELLREEPIVIFANPDGKQDQQFLWQPGARFLWGARFAGHVALLEVGQGGGSKTVDPVPSTFEPGKRRGPIPKSTFVRHIRGSRYVLCMCHGNLLTTGRQDACEWCQWRKNWLDLATEEREKYLEKVLVPWLFTIKNGRIERSGTTFSALRDRLLKGGPFPVDSVAVAFSLDESGGAAKYGPKTASHILARDRKDGEAPEGFCMPEPTEEQVRAAARRRLVDVPRSAHHGLVPERVSRFVDELLLRWEWHNLSTGYWKGPLYVPVSPGNAGAQAIDVLKTYRKGKPLLPGIRNYPLTVEGRCMHEGQAPDRGPGWIFWRLRSTAPSRGEHLGSPVLFFAKGSNDKPVQDVFGAPDIPAEGRWPVPRELMYAGACMSASRKELAMAFVEKGTRVFIGYEVVAWSAWGWDFSEELSDRLFRAKDSPEDAYRNLKAQYVRKIRPAMKRRTDEGKVE